MMEHQHYTIKAGELSQQLKRLRVPHSAVVHFWYETPTQNSVKQDKQADKKSWKDSALFGMWADRDETKDATAYVQQLRQPRSFDV